MSDPLCGRKVVAKMSYRLCGWNEAQNSRLDPYADGTHKKLSVHKCQNLAILDRTLLSIRQGPGSRCLIIHVKHWCKYVVLLAPHITPF